MLVLRLVVCYAQRCFGLEGCMQFEQEKKYEASP